MTEAQPDPAREWAEAWLEDHPDARPADVHRAVGVVYGKDEADRVVAAVFRKPLTVADIPAGQGPASLFLATVGTRDGGITAAPGIGDGELWLWFKDGDGTLLMLERAPSPTSRADFAARWDHLAATLPTLTAEEGP